MANSIPRLVGDKLFQANTSNVANGQVVLIVDNYQSLDNNREIKRIFPHQIPAWIKNVVIANNLRPTENDVCAGTIASTGYPTGESSSYGATKDPYPLGTVWVNCKSASGFDGSPDTPSVPPDPLHEFYVLVDSPAINTSSSVATWIRISLEDEVSNHKCSSVRSFMVANLNDFGKTAASGQNEMFAFLPNTSVTFTNQQETIATEVTDTNAAWFVKNYRFGDYVQQTAIKLDNPYYQIHRSCNVTDDGTVWSSWKTVDLRSNVPVGSIIMYSGAIAPDGWLFCRGQLLNRADYPELYNVIGTRYNTGSVESGKFMLPNLSSRVPQGLPSGAAPSSNYVDAGLPELTGHAEHIFSSVNGPDPTFSGVFKKSGWWMGGGAKSAGNDHLINLQFSASESNSIYGNSTTVQPPAVLINFIIKSN